MSRANSFKHGGFHRLYQEEDVDRVRDFRCEQFRWYLRLRKNRKLYTEININRKDDKAYLASLPQFERILEEAVNQIRACNMVISYVTTPNPYHNKTPIPSFPPEVKHEISRARQYLDNPSWKDFIAH